MVLVHEETQRVARYCFSSRRGTTASKHAVLEEETHYVGTLGELLADGLLDHARARKADQGAGSAMLRSPSMA